MASLSRLAPFALSLALLAPAAYAQDASSQAAAQALFEQARKLMADGNFAEACPKLAESQRLDPGAGTLLNLGQCYEKSGRTASAWVTFKDAAAAADLRHRADWSARARERAQALEPTLSRLVIDVPSTGRTPGLQVWRDGVEVGAAVWGTQIPIDPGEHTIEALAPGKKRWRTKVTVQPKADNARVAIPPLEEDEGVGAPSTPAPTPASAPLAPAPAAQTPAAPGADTSPRESDGSSRRGIGLVVGAVGLAGLVTGSIFGVVALSKDSASKTDCPSSPCPNTPQGAQGLQENDSAKSAAGISTIALIAGGALVATGAVLYLTAPKAQSSASLRVTPLIGPSVAGVGIGGSL
jgi:serine/threonine-protein kinase